MTDHEWNTSAAPTAMIEFVAGYVRPAWVADGSGWMRACGVG